MAISREKKPMRALLPLLFALLVSGCAALEGKPQPAPPAKEMPQEISRNQTQGLQEIGAVNVTVMGSPMDVETALKAKASAAKADYYVIIMMDDSVFPGRWYGRALLYRS